MKKMKLFLSLFLLAFTFPSCATLFPEKPINTEIEVNEFNSFYIKTIMNANRFTYQYSGQMMFYKEPTNKSDRFIIVACTANLNEQTSGKFTETFLIDDKGNKYPLVIIRYWQDKRIGRNSTSGWDEISNDGQLSFTSGSEDDYFFDLGFITPVDTQLDTLVILDNEIDISNINGIK